MSLLSVKHCTISYPNNQAPAVNGIDFDIVPGQTLGIMGESGSGKSSLALGLFGLLTNATVQTQSISWQGKLVDLAHCRARLGKQVSFVFQQPLSSLHPLKCVGNQVAEVYQVHKNLSAQKAQQNVLHLFEKLQLPNPEALYHKHPHQCSGGMCQRIIIAMALACEPDLLICDEPTTALDVTTQLEVLNWLKALQQTQNFSMLLISHDIGVIRHMANTAIVMQKGKVVETGLVQNLIDKPGEEYTKVLVESRLEV